MVAFVLSVGASARGETPEGWSGQIGVSYGGSLASAGAQPLAGPIVRADLAFRAGERHLTLRSDPVSLDRLNVAFELRERADLLSVTLARGPGAGTPGGERTDAQVLAVRRGEAGPTLQVLFHAQHARGTSTFVTRFALDDRVRSPGWGFSSLDWRTAVQVQQVDVAAVGLRRTTTTASFGVGAAFGGDDGRRWRPTGAVELGAERGSRVAERSRVDLGLTGALTPEEQLSVRLRWDVERADDGSSRRAHQQRLGLASRRLAPLRLTFETDRRVSLTGDTAYGWNAGAEAPLAERWTLGVRYQGAADERGGEHGVSARLAVQGATASATLRADAEAGARWSDADGWRPTAALGVRAARRGAGPFTGSVAGSFRYADAWAGALNADGRVVFAWGDLVADAELAIADAVTFGGGAVLAIALFDPIAAQLGVSARTTLGGASSASIDLGAQYRFGGR
jgi:hypothetical protein